MGLDPLVGGALVSGGLGLIGDLFNVGQQGQNLAYQKRLQRELFAREDNAVQRRVADLRAAGLSPTLAAGSAAGAGSVVHTEAPQTEAGERFGKTVAGAMELAANRIGLRKLNAEAGRSEADKLKAEAEAEIAQVKKKYAEQREYDEVRNLGASGDVMRTRQTGMAYENTVKAVSAEISARLGLTEAQARTAQEVVRAEMDRYYAESEKKGGAGFRGQAEGWVGLAAQILNAIRGGQSVFMRGGR